MKKYFKDKSYINYNSYPYREKEPVDMEIVTTKGSYDLGSIEQNNILFCLCNDARDCWSLLLRDYPDLREFLWNEYKLLKNVEKEEQISLIEKMIKEKNKEKELLENPEIREGRIFQIKKE